MELCRRLLLSVVLAWDPGFRDNRGATHDRLAGGLSDAGFDVHRHQGTHLVTAGVANL